MSKYLLGIDNGNTFSKAALFDFHGNEIAVASCAASTEFPHPGWTERNMEMLWLSTVMAIREVLGKSEIDPAEIAGIGNTGHGNGLYLLNKDGHPLRYGIQSMDTRASGVLADWNQSNIHKNVFPITLQSFWPAQANALLAWLKSIEPQTYENISAILMVKDFIKYRLTGDISSDFTDMSCANLVDIRKRSYSSELMNIYGISEMYDALPPLKASCEIAGTVSPAAAQQTGLTVGTPVVSGLIDVDASAIGSGVVNENQACIVMGSWSINEVITREPIADPSLFQTAIFADPELFLSIEGSATSATNLEWFITQFCGDERAEAKRRKISVYDVCSEVVDNLPPGSSKIVFHPFLFGSNVQPSARAGFYGIAGWHTRAHLLRALFEGVVFGHLSHIEKLRTAGGQINTARLTGGGSRSDVWSQMFADIVQIPIEITDGNEVGARGAAISAGIGAGIYSDYADAAQAAVSVVRIHEPNPLNTPLYMEGYAGYKRLLEAMQTPWNSMSKLS